LDRKLSNKADLVENSDLSSNVLPVRVHS
jgi:hypothetical protein